jgi:hypothetical protein
MVFAAQMAECNPDKYGWSIRPSDGPIAESLRRHQIIYNDRSEGSFPFFFFDKKAAAWCNRPSFDPKKVK